MTPKTVALIPLRGGSKGIPGKNIKQIGGKPLCAWTLESALSTRSIDRVYVSTECPEIAATVASISNQIQILERPIELASDTATTEQVMLHFAATCEFDVLVTIQATSPLLSSDDLDQALSLFIEKGFDSLLSGVVQKRFLWTLDGSPLNYDPQHRPRRQDWSGSLIENGAFYITKKATLEECQCRLGGKIGVFPMKPETYLEIDDLDDWNAVDILLREKNCSHVNSRLSGIELLMVDVDGTLTDGGMYYTENGETIKKFNTRDAVGMKLLTDLGVHVVVVTRENSPIAAARARKLGLPCIVGAEDKADVVKRLASDYNLDLTKVAVIGDDLFDLPAMALAGASACPSDAIDQVKAQCDILLSSPGGRGAVREFCELIVASRSSQPTQVA